MRTERRFVDIGGAWVAVDAVTAVEPDVPTDIGGSWVHLGERCLHSELSPDEVMALIDGALV